MTNNLRIIYDNIADISTVTVSSTASSATIASNLQSDIKSKVWRSATVSDTVNTVNANIIIAFPKYCTITGIVLAFNNLGGEAKARLRLYTGTAVPTHSGTVDSPGISGTSTLVTVYDSGSVGIPIMQYADIDSFTWGYDPMALTGYENRKNYSVLWVPNSGRVPCNRLALQIYDPNSIDKYIEVSRLITGIHWTPTYNTSFGLSTSIVDNSTSERSEAGDLIINEGSQHNTMSFPLDYLDTKDKNVFNNIIRSKGTKKPIYVSLFPENSDDHIKENIHQIYGKFSQVPGLTHPIFDMYSSSIEIEEI